MIASPRSWLARRVELRGDFLYILVKPGDSEASVTGWALGVDWYPWKKVGFGAQFKYYKCRYDRGLYAVDLGGTLVYQGGQLYLSFLPCSQGVARTRRPKEPAIFP